ncbi:hypothetical protein BG57_00875 [Caballeronia grimmiae]|uniref:Uncharacterized protein n=1 Tax=Caballeronia grimmiae TaxID=1071679 RepID=A0A069PAF1_9BURK|nr:hypothetical protein BG57_00875 [Caballeronia grimmiae]
MLEFWHVFRSPVFDAYLFWVESSAYDRRDFAQPSTDGDTSKSTNFYDFVKQDLFTRDARAMRAKR